MNWVQEVEKRIKRQNRILFAKDSLYLQDLRDLLGTQNHRVLVLWALDLAEESVQAWNQKHPDELRPIRAYQAAQNWSMGKIKMREAQRKILDCHAVAKEIDSLEDQAICHAIAQACSVVHTPGHAIGYPMYDLTSLVYHYGWGKCISPIEDRKAFYIDRLFYWSRQIDQIQRLWASFL